MKRLALIILLSLTLAGCAAQEVWAPDEAVRDAAYTHPGPPTITVYTVVNNGSGAGAHSGVLISGSQRVLFDPAGSFSVNVVPERNDVHYGMTEQIREFYELFHARESFHVIAQEIEVSAEVAELAIARAEAYGAVPKGFCTIAATEVLRTLPGFEHVRRKWGPNSLMEDIAKMDGVVTRRIYEYDDDDKSIVLAEFQAAMARSELAE
ncbi:MAG: hypothetical protein QGI08_09705 [Paracoccaceae bacterium]|nr:hypothetical protein [Paracoccaceae bacterium]MDP7185982.1 hypothetical protein [Paracoccaceae bacterium]